MKRRQFFAIGVGLFLVVLVGISGQAQARLIISNNFYTVPLPNYSTGGGWPGGVMGGYPKVEGYDVVWTGMGAGNSEIFHFDGSTTTQVTYTMTPQGSFAPYISSWLGPRNVAYVSDTGGSTNNVFHYNIDTGVTTQLTSSSPGFYMAVNGFRDPYIVTQVCDTWLFPGWMDIDVWDGTKTFTLSPRVFNYAPQVSNNQVIWEAFDSMLGISDIFLCDIPLQNTIQLTGAPPWSYHDPKLDYPHWTYWYTDGNETNITYRQFPSTSQHVAHSNSLQIPLLEISGPHTFWAWTDDTLGYGVFHYHYQPFPIFERLIGPPSDMGVCDCMDTCYSHLAIAMHEPILGGEYNIYVWDIANHGPMCQVSGHPRNSDGPVFVQVSSNSYVGYGYIPVVVWEDELGSTSTKAYMATRPVCTAVGDFNGDCEVVLLDFAYLAQYWGQSWPNPSVMPFPSPDLDGDLDVDWADVAILRANWLQCHIHPPIYRNRGVTFP